MDKLDDRGHISEKGVLDQNCFLLLARESTTRGLYNWHSTVSCFVLKSQTSLSSLRQEYSSNLIHFPASLH